MAFVKATAFNNGALNGTGYWDKLCWVTYDTKNWRFRKPDKKDAPRSEVSYRGVGCLHSHYYEPNTQELAAYVFKIEMWDDARDLTKTMQPGECWYLPNARAMVDSCLHLYGKLVETHKSKQLDEVSQKPHLTHALQTQKKFQQGEGCPFAWFDNWLIEDFDEEVGLFNCTAEVLHVDLASAEESLVYVTDYTFNPDLIELVESAPWALGFDRQILKIALEGGQKGRAHDLQPGMMYRIKNLWFIRRPGVNGAFGCLEGDEQLIIVANDYEKDEVKALLQRKETWKLEMKQVAPLVKSPGDSPPTSYLPTP
ncbi:hypothetical protein BDR03DRAFT_1017368 [Suillus americanus]|nr:hypothetical protein BDR03DRAFT_1017368 [Suillus americanus]